MKAAYKITFDGVGFSAYRKWLFGWEYMGGSYSHLFEVTLDFVRGCAKNHARYYAANGTEIKR